MSEDTSIEADVYRDIFDSLELMLAGRDLDAYDRLVTRIVATPEPGEVVTSTLAHFLELLTIMLAGRGPDLAAKQLEHWRTTLLIDEAFVKVDEVFAGVDLEPDEDA